MSLLNTLQKVSQLQSSEQATLYTEALANNYRKSLYLTAKYLCGYQDTNKHTHKDIILALEAQTKRKLIVMPRGTFKSSIGVVAYVIWLLINDPNLRILIDSEVYKNSKNSLREIKQILASDKFVEMFGNWRSSNWNEGELTIAPRTKIAKEATLTCSGVGAIKVGQHYDVIIFDDLNSNKNSGTPEACEKVITHYQMSVPILEPDGVIVVIGTRYSHADLIGKIVELELTDEQREEIKKE